MRRLLYALLLLLLTVEVRAGLLPAAAGTLMTCGAACLVGCSRDMLTTGVGSPTNSGSCLAGTTAPGSMDFVAPDGAAVLVVSYAATGTFTVQVEESIDNGLTWVPVQGSAFNNGIGTLTAVAITNPAGRYRAYVSTCTACTMTVKYRAVRSTPQ